MLTGEEADQDEPRRGDLLEGGVVVHDAPHARDLVLLLLAAGLLVGLGRAEELLDVGHDGAAVLALLLAQEGGVLVDLVGRLRVRERLLDLLDELADGLVRLPRQQRQLQGGDGDWDDQVAEEELAVAKGRSRALEDDAVDQEERAGGVEGAGEQGQDQARVSGEGIGQLEGRYVGEGAAERQEQVAAEQAVERHRALKRHAQGAGGEQHGADQAAQARAVVVEYGADGQGGHVGAHGGDGEHEVEVDLDTGALADAVAAGADVAVRALQLEDGLYGGIAEHDAGGEEAVHDSDGDLDWRAAHTSTRRHAGTA